MELLYTPSNVKAADQRRWSLTLFAKSRLPYADIWLSRLREVVERDGVRILEFQPRACDVWQFYLSTQPVVAPPQVVKSVKGRLQHLLRPAHLDAFRRNFMRSVFCPSYYSGTVGEYDTGSIWTSIASSRGPTDTASVETGRRLEGGVGL